VLFAADCRRLSIGTYRLQDQFYLVRRLVVRFCLAGKVEEPRPYTRASFNLSLEHNRELDLHAPGKKMQLLPDTFLIASETVTSLLMAALR
jgi:hypothetical protein